MHGFGLEVGRFLKIRNCELGFLLPIQEMRNCESENDSFFESFLIPFASDSGSNSIKMTEKWSMNWNHNSLGIGISSPLVQQQQPTRRRRRRSPKRNEKRRQAMLIVSRRSVRKKTPTHGGTWGVKPLSGQLVRRRQQWVSLRTLSLTISEQKSISSYSPYSIKDLFCPKSLASKRVTLIEDLF